MSLKKAVIASLIILIAGGAALAKTTTDISVISSGAKAVAMGRAGVAVTEGAKNVFVNPALISNTESWGVTSMSSQLMNLVDYKFLSANKRLGKGVFGVSYVGATSPAGYETTDELSLASASPISYGSSVMAFSYGLKLNDIIKAKGSLSNLSIGTNVKYMQKGFSGGSLSDASGAGVTVDLGLLLEANPDLSFGANLQNLGGKIAWGTDTEEDLPTIAKVGLAKKLMDGKILVAVDVESHLSESKPMTVHGGVEWRPVELFALRVGVDQDAISSSDVATNLCAGAGIKVGAIELDFAYRQDSTITENSNYYVSLSFSPFQGKVAKKVVTDKIEAGVQKQAEPKAEKSILDYYQDSAESKTSTEKDILDFYQSGGLID